MPIPDFHHLNLFCVFHNNTSIKFFIIALAIFAEGEEKKEIAHAMSAQATSHYLPPKQYLNHAIRLSLQPSFCNSSSVKL
jgi:hypothetical protein